MIAKSLLFINIFSNAAAFSPHNYNQQSPFKRTQTQHFLSQQTQTTPKTDKKLAEALPPKGPSFLEALFGIATNGSPWEYMLRMKEDGYDGVVPVDLSLIGKYNFLLSPESVRAATVEESKILPRRFSVPLFKQLELVKGLYMSKVNDIIETKRFVFLVLNRRSQWNRLWTLLGPS